MSVMSMLIVPILLEALSAPVGLDMKEVARFAEVYKWKYIMPISFILSSCTCVLDINECTRREDTCSDFAQCSNTIGSFECSCLPGYQGDGRVCRGQLGCMVPLILL